MLHPQVPSITIRAVQPVIAALEALGHDIAPIMASCHLSMTITDDPDGRIPHATMMQFWQEAQQQSQDEFLGIHLAEAAPLDSFGIHAYAMQSSLSLRDAYHRACRYQRLIHAATNLSFEVSEDEWILCHALPSGRAVPRQPAEFLVMTWLRFGRLVTGQAWIPSLVSFAHAAPSDQTEYARVFQAPIQFSSGRTALHGASHFLDTANPQTNPGLLGILDAYADRLLDQTTSITSLSEQVRHHLLALLPSGIPPVTDVANSLHISVRTLHRKLRQEGTTYRALVDQLRQEQASRYLADAQISIAEVAFLLGFSELSSFYRAFKRWTGTTPAEYRMDS